MTDDKTAEPEPEPEPFTYLEALEMNTKASITTAFCTGLTENWEALTLMQNRGNEVKVRLEFTALDGGVSYARLSVQDGEWVEKHLRDRIAYLSQSLRDAIKGMEKHHG